MWGNDGAKLCDDGATLRVGEKLRDGDGATRTGAMLRGSTRSRLGELELERGALDQDEDDGAVRRTLSPVKAWRALAGTRGVLL